MSLDKIIRRICLKQMCVWLILVVLYVILFSILVPAFISGYFDAYDTGMFIWNIIMFLFFCYLPISSVWHLLTGRYEYYTEETEVTKYCWPGDKEAEALGIGPDEPVHEVTIIHTFDLHSHPKRVFTVKEIKLRKIEA